MNILALDTSTEYLSLSLLQALADEQYTYVNREMAAGQAHSQHILPLIQEVLDEAQVSLAAMDAIVFGEGPGSFTGLRIACGVAQGLAFGIQRPLVGVGTLLAMAEASGHARVITCLDARMSEVYHAAYEKRAGAWVTVCAPNLTKPEDVPLVDGEGWFAAGSGWQVAEEVLLARHAGRLSGMDVTVAPRASVMATLAVEQVRRGEGVAPALAHPVYVRNKVALKTHERLKLRE